MPANLVYAYSPSTTALHLELSSFGETAGSVMFQTVEVMKPAAFVTAEADRCGVTGDGSSAKPFQVGYDAVADSVVDISSGIPTWWPMRTTSTPFGWPVPSVGSWLGAGGFNQLLGEHQGEQPMPAC